MLGSFNTRISINAYTSSQDAGGGSTRSLSYTYDIWANVENRTGVAIYSEGQRQADYDYKIKVRAYTERPVTTANTVTYKGNELRIESVHNVNEGKISFLVLKCSVYGGT